MRLLAVALTAVLIVVTVAAIVGAFALLARRLLGLRFGLVRLLLAGLVGFAVAGPIAQALAGPIQAGGGTATPLWFLILAAAFVGAAPAITLVAFAALPVAAPASASCRCWWRCPPHCWSWSWSWSCPGWWWRP
jgi:hypothetical protein